MTDSDDTSSSRGIILGMVIKLAKVISVMLLVGLLVGLISSKVKDYLKDPVSDTTPDTAPDQDLGDCVSLDQCKVPGLRQSNGSCSSETNVEDGTSCGSGGSSCMNGQCVTDCVGSYSTWSDCSETCGDGLQTMSYNVTTPASQGGTPCPVSQSQSCNIGPCPIQCTSPPDQSGYIVTSGTVDDPSYFSVDCDTGYHGTPSHTCGAAGGPYVLSGCDANPTCQGYDCTGSTNTINSDPVSITCLADTCTSDECCTVAPVAQVPVQPTCTTPNLDGYLIDDSTGLSSSPVTGVTCDASQGWYIPSGGVIGANCIVSGNEYTLNGCVHGCKKPLLNMVGYNLLENSTSPVGSGSLTGATCSYSSDIPTFQCASPGSVYVPGGCDTTQTCASFPCPQNTTANSPSTSCLADTCTSDECCTAVTPTCMAPPSTQDGYIIADGTIRRSTGIVTDGVTCDASQGWYALGVINANCDPATSLYRLTGCTQGCKKPDYDIPWLDMTNAPTTLPISPLQGTQGITCTYSDATPSVSCNRSGQHYSIANCPHSAATPVPDATATTSGPTDPGLASGPGPASGPGSAECVDDPNWAADDATTTCATLARNSGLPGVQGMRCASIRDAAGVPALVGCPVTCGDFIEDDSSFVTEDGRTCADISAIIPAGLGRDASETLKRIVCPTGPRAGMSQYYGSTNDSLQRPTAGWGVFTVGAGDACLDTCGDCGD